MKRIIISAFVAAILSISLAPAFAAPSDHDLKTSEGVKKFWEDQGNRGGDSGGN
jgi:hypothetical protein